jgi:hypothetical protein
VTHVLVLGDPSGLATLHAALAQRCIVVDRSTRSHDELAGTGYRTDDGVSLSVLEDHVGLVPYVTLDGPGAARWAAEIRRLVPCVALSSVLGDLTGATGQGGQGGAVAWIRGLSRLAVLRDDVDAASSTAAMVRTWTTALAHRDRIVRRAAIRTAHGARWPALRDAVVARIARDPELARPLRQLADHLARTVAGLKP